MGLGGGMGWGGGWGLGCTGLDKMYSGKLHIHLSSFHPRKTSSLLKSERRSMQAVRDTARKE